MNSKHYIEDKLSDHIPDESSDKMCSGCPNTGHGFKCYGGKHVIMSCSTVVDGQGNSDARIPPFIPLARAQMDQTVKTASAIATMSNVLRISLP